MTLWKLIELVPAPPIENMETFLLITVTVSVVSSLLLLQPVRGPQ